MKATSYIVCRTDETHLDCVTIQQTNLTCAMCDHLGF